MLGDVASKDVAEVAGRDNERHFAVRSPQRSGGDKIVGGLGNDATPVDGIDAREADAITEGMIVEHALHQSLAVVEVPVDSDGMDMSFGRRGHHAPLDVGNATLRVQDDDVDAL